MPKIVRASLIGQLLASAAFVSSPALAQDASPQSTAPASGAPAANAAAPSSPAPVGDAAPQSAPAPAPAEESYAGDIVVTAQKRSESANKVGMTISAISGDTLARENIRSVADLTRVVPGISYTPSFTAQPVYTIRGVGFYESSMAAYPAVSVYVDQVPLPFPALTNNVGLDLERVEVLKGPQGILFGQNSTGGAINYVARKPTDKLEAGFSLGYGSFRDISGSGYISGPLSDTVRARLSFQVENANGWQHPYSRPEPGTNGAVGKYSARLLLDWRPSDNLRFELNLTGSVDNSEPMAPQKIGTKLSRTDSPFNGPFLIAYPNAPNDAQAADWSLSNHPAANNRLGQVSLRADYDVTKDITLTSITSYVRYDEDMRMEYGGTYSNANELTKLIGYIDSFTQELRLANSASNRLRWVVGGNYERSNVNDYNELDYSGATTADSLGTLGNPFYSNQKMRNYAGFANVDFDVSKALTVKAGIRYTESDRTTVACNLAGSRGVAPLFDFLTILFNPGQTINLPPLTPTDCVGFVQRGNLFVPARTPTTDSLNENNVSWRVGVDFKPAPNALFYLNLAKGYKAGSFPTVVSLAVSQFQPVRQESVMDYEGGFKLGLLNRKLQFNAAAFYYDYANKQIRSQEAQPPIGALNVLINIPKSRIWGVEFDIVYQPMQGLRLTTAGTYLDSKITNIAPGVYNADSEPGNYKGSVLPYTPKFTMNGAIDYSWNVTGGLTANVGATWSHRSSSNASIGSPALYKINAYDLLDLRAGIGSSDDRYRLDLWARNVTNKFYWNNVVYSFDTIVRYADRPATYGGTFSVKF